MSKEGVIQIVDSLNVGGAEVVAVNIANALSEKAYNSHICATRKEGGVKSKIDTDVGFLSLGRKKIIDFKALLTFSKYIRKNSIRILHAHSTSIFFAVQIKLIHWNVKVIWHDHYGISDDYTKRPVWIIRICSYFLSAILSVNKGLQIWAQEKLSCRKVFYLPNFAELNDEEKSVTNLKGKKGNRIVIVAGMRPQKNHLNLLSAFLIIHKQFPSWTLHIIGKDYEDSYSKEIHTFIEQNQMVDCVYFYGLRRDIKNILSQANIAVLSSNSEGLPIALLEYGLSKTVSVSTDVGQCSEVIDNANFIVKKESPELLAKAIIKLIQNEKLREEEGLRLYKRIVNNYTSKASIDKLIDIYTDA